MTSTVISTYLHETSKAKADVVLEGDSYKINYYDARGELFKTEPFPEKSVWYVESAAENWALGIKQLNG